MREYVAHVAGQDTLGSLLLVRIHAPDLIPHLRPGHFVLARLYPTWDPYLRVPLFPAHMGHATWHTYVPPETSFALELMSRMPAGTPIRLWGPYGTPFPPPTGEENAVIVTQDVYTPYALGLVQEYSRAGNVVLLVERTGDVLPEDLVWLPPAAEYRTVDAVPGALEDALAPLIPWAQRFFFVGPKHWPHYFARWLDERKIRLERNTAWAMIPDGITCGLGLCDTCVLETEQGNIRVCRKGPVLDLARWYTHPRRR
ncbi:MAG: hypothetical protein GXO55_05790 [Chloroflexi bacterium]|nr:hypothetical protein [Chloroflexota bacterium]